MYYINLYRECLRIPLLALLLIICYCAGMVVFVMIFDITTIIRFSKNVPHGARDDIRNACKELEAAKVAHQGSVIADKVVRSAAVST
jgi:hypothetical protein